MATEPSTSEQSPTHFLESKRFWSMPAAAGAAWIAAEGAELGLDFSPENVACLKAVGTAVGVWLFGMWRGQRPVALLAPRKKES